MLSNQLPDPEEPVGDAATDLDSANPPGCSGDAAADPERDGTMMELW
jgi:hypothetical protein